MTGAASDRLGLRMRCERVLVRDAWLLPPRRAWLRVLARLSWEAAAPRAGPAGRVREAWVEGWIAREFQRLADEQALEAQDGLRPARSPDAAFYRARAQAWGLSPARARQLCVRVNALPVSERRALRAAGVLRGAASSAHKGKVAGRGRYEGRKTSVSQGR